MDNLEYTAEDLVNAYVNIREKKRSLDDEYKKQIEELESNLEEIETVLLEMCKTIGADSIKTAYGTVMRGVKSVYTTTNWEEFYKTVYDHKAFDLLERRIHQGNLRQFLEENENVHPAGLNVDKKYTITVRKAK